MSDKYSRPITSRLLIVGLLAIGFIYVISHKNHNAPAHSHGDHHSHVEGGDHHDGDGSGHSGH